MSIRLKFFLIIFSISLVTIVLGGLFYQSSTKIIQDNALQVLGLSTDFIQKGLINIEREKTMRVAGFATDQRIVEFLQNYSINKDSETVTNLRDYLISQKLPIDSSMISIEIVNLNKEVIVSTRNLAKGEKIFLDQDIVRQMTAINANEKISHAYVLENTNSSTAQPQMVFLVPIYNAQQKHIGFLMGRFLLTDFSSILWGNVHEHTSGTYSPLYQYTSLDVYLVNKDYIRITPSVFDSEVLMQKKDVFSENFCVGEDHTLATSYTDANGIKKFRVSACAESEDWTLVVEIEKQDFFSQFTNLFLKIAIVLLIVYAVIFFVAFMFLDIMATRIKENLRILNKIKSGDLSSRTENTGKDEIGLIGVSVNLLAKKIEEDKKNLELEHEKQQQAIDELEKINNLMVDRELRMVELKTELKKYKK